MAGAMAGYGGKVAWGASSTHSDNADVNVHSWTLDSVADTHDTTDFLSSGDRTFIGGLRSWSGSYEVYLDDTKTPLHASSDLGSLTVATDVLTLYASDSGLYYQGPAIITGVHPSVTIDGVNTLTFDFQGTSDLDIAP